MLKYTIQSNRREVINISHNHLQTLSLEINLRVTAGKDRQKVLQAKRIAGNQVIKNRRKMNRNLKMIYSIKMKMKKTTLTTPSTESITQRRPMTVFVMVNILMNNWHYLDREPMLYVDVNLGSSGSQRIVVFDGDSAETLAADFAAKFNLDGQMREKLTIMLHQQIAGVLEKIDEEQATSSNNSNIDQEWYSPHF